MSRPPRPGGQLKREHHEKKAGVLKCVFVCTTGLSAEKKKDICQKILANGGEYYDSFKSGVTHLIATEACTDKYKIAVKLGIPVVSPSWVDASIDKGELADVTEFALAPLYKVIICSSGFSSDKKQEIAELVKELGGDYTEDLEEDVTHFLIAAKPEGEKFRAAKEWRIPTVSLAWLEECERKKCCVAAEPYPVKREIDRPPVRNAAPEKLRSQNCVSEQVLQAAFAPDDQIEASWQGLPESRALEDCRVFLAGLERCSASLRAALLGLLHKASATPAYRVQNLVTHVVVAHQHFLTDRAVDMLLKFPTSPPIVSVRWLFDSVANGRVAPTSNYPVLSSQLPKPKPQSPCPPRVSASQPVAAPAARSGLRRAHSIPLPPKHPAEACQQPSSRDLESLTARSPAPMRLMEAMEQDENAKPSPVKAMQALEMSPEGGSGGDSGFPPPRKLRNVFSRGIGSSFTGGIKRSIDTGGAIDDFQLTQDRAPPKRRSTLETNLRPSGKIMDTQICNEESQLIGYGED